MYTYTYIYIYIQLATLNQRRQTPIRCPAETPPPPPPSENCSVAPWRVVTHHVTSEPYAEPLPMP